MSKIKHSKLQRAVFLDRDGVINASILDAGIPKPPRTPEEVVILEGVIEAIQLLKSNNFIPVVVTNQPDVARGSTTLAEVVKINSKKLMDMKFLDLITAYFLKL